MDDKQLEERLNLLKESYERVPEQMDVEGVLNKIEEVPQVVEKKNKGIKWQRVAVWIVSIASVFVIGLLGVSNINEEASQGNEQRGLNIFVEQFLEKLKEEYPKEREKRRQILHLDEEEFSQIPFIKSADSLYEFYISVNNKDFFYGRDATMLQLIRDGLINSLYLPSQMLEEIEKNKLILSEEETVQFFNSYSMKIKELQEFYNYKDKVLVEQAKILEQEGLYLEKGQYRYKMNGTNYINIKQYLAPTVFGYFSMLEKEPFTYAGELIYSFDDSVAVMFLLENYLFESSDFYYDKERMKLYYTEIFHAIVKGTNDQSVFDNSGAVKEEYRELWKVMTTETSNSPVNYLLTPIVQEFEASNWAQSDSWEVLDYNDIDDALHLAINGDLEQFIENP